MLETVLPVPDPATLRRAACIARENAQLLQAAMAGLRAASRRLSDLRSGRSLTTYDGAGRRIDRSTPIAGSKRI